MAAAAMCCRMAAQIGAPPTQPGQQPRAQQLPLSGRPQVVPADRGGVPTGAAASEPLALTLDDAIQRGLRYNLATISAGDATRQARAERLAALAQLLPDINGNVRETVQQINLAATGLRFHAPGFNFPTIVGPFNYFDARASFGETASLTGLRNWRAGRENLRSAELSVKDSRELVVLAVTSAYLQLIASAARIETVRAQIESAQTVNQQAIDRNRSGLNARIDVSRSQVELQTEQQRLTSFTNDFAKQKLALARIIGLPMAQAFTLADAIGYRETPPPDVPALIQRAVTNRPDVQAAAAQVKAAEHARGAATAEYFPSLALSGDYGAIGVTPSQSHGTFSVTGAVAFPIFRSGRIRADIEQADAALAQRRAEYDDAKARAEQDVRNAALDLQAARELVRVSESSRRLAGETLTQSRDRFRAGVSDTVELVQAQETVAAAEQDYINALYAFNLAKVNLARATGEAERSVPELLKR
jgi:outer membrane protein TolC